MNKLQPQKFIACSSDSWQELLQAMNKKTETVVISRAAFEDVLTCHQFALPGPKRVIPQVWGKKRKVCLERPVLFELVQEHGNVCRRNK